MLVKNHWYVAAWSKDLTRDLLPRTLLNERLVLFRKEDGSAAALADRCPHRNLPLSAGRLIGDTVRCGYHGLQFDATGTCVKAPGEPRIPEWCRVPAYPIAERHGWTFVWMGDPALARSDTVPDFHGELADPAWGAASGQLLVQCGYRLMLDNLLDLSHLAYVHSSSTGNEEVANAARVEVSTDGSAHVRQTRLMRNVSAAPAFVYYGGYNGAIDRWQVTDYIAPSYIRINNGSRARGPENDAIECSTDLGDWGFRVLHAITPETETSAHQFWAVPFRKDLVAAQDHSLWQEQMDNVLREDHEVYVQQQSQLNTDPLSPDGDVRPDGALRGDRGLYEMRRILRHLHEQEAGPRPV